MIMATEIETVATAAASTPSPTLQLSDAIPNSFDLLVRSLSDVLGPSSGLDSEDVDVQEIVRLMSSYNSRPEEWQIYAMGDDSRSYTRNLVDKGNGKSNLLVLVWSPGKGSPIHDHANAHCVMKVLYGRLKETLYDWPEGTRGEGGKCGCEMDGSATPPKVRRETVYGENEVTYMSDALGIHRISNPDSERVAISLHCKLSRYAVTELFVDC